MAARAETRGGPDFALEQSLLAATPADLFATTPLQVIGIDEAGRGPWAGPVVAGAAWINPDHLKALPAGIDDSKRLTPGRRQELLAGLTSLAENPEILRFATASVSAAAIDERGILPATFDAMEAAAIEIAATSDSLALIVDGHLAPPFADLARRQTITVMPVVKGDQRALSIAIAALAAKEARDAEMRQLDKAFPGYGWASNMGYGTRDHADALAKQGPTPQHRLSFRPVARAAEAHGYTR
ncbi:MAG: ribonuclease HII [Candidatus Puniceispirillales bacterium]